MAEPVFAKDIKGILKHTEDLKIKAAVPIPAKRWKTSRIRWQPFRRRSPTAEWLRPKRQSTCADWLG